MRGFCYTIGGLGGQNDRNKYRKRRVFLAKDIVVIPKDEELLKDYRGKDQELRKYSFLEDGANY